MCNDPLFGALDKFYPSEIFQNLRFFMGPKKFIFQNKPSFSWLTSRLFYWAGGDTQSICLFVLIRHPRCATTPFFVRMTNFGPSKWAPETCVFWVRPKMVQIPTKPSFLHSTHHVGVRGPLFFSSFDQIWPLCITPRKLGPSGDFVINTSHRSAA